MLRASQSTCAMPVAPIARANVGSSAVGSVASMVIVAAGALTWLARVAASLADRRRSTRSDLVWDGQGRPWLEKKRRSFVNWIAHLPVLSNNYKVNSYHSRKVYWQLFGFQPVLLALQTVH